MGEMMFDQFSTQELEDELVKRREAESKNTKPTPLGGVVSFELLYNVCRAHIDRIAENNDDEDDVHYIYEAAMTCIYGLPVWKWINKSRR